jgi:Phospholipase_D-nuclease N-terminal
MNVIVDSSPMIGIWQIMLLTILILPVIALISILKNDFKNNDKLIWVLVTLFLPLFG